MVDDLIANERMLLEQVAVGNRLAFKSLYSLYLDNVFRYIYLFTKSEYETEEILQEVFIKIWENRERLTEIQSFKNYLFKAAKNKVLDALRTEKVRHRVMAEIKRNNALSDISTLDAVAFREYYQIVQTAINKLPPKRRLIFRLNTENGLSLDEIAQQLCISKSAVKKQLYKAFDFVREYLALNGEISLPALLFLFDIFLWL